MKTTTMIALALALLCTSTVAFAKKHSAPKAQAHHCQLNGTEVQKNKKACLRAGGTWETGTPTAKPATAPAEPIK